MLGIVQSVVLSEAELAGRVIEPGEFVADREAFVDVRIERSKGKASYSMIGPGVSQNAEQTVNLAEPHGFNLGAASMPNGVVNNPHLHYTAEVFVCTGGRWRFSIGEHGDQELEIGAGDVFSAPPWVFRGFTNVGPDDGWLFVVLGGDDTGGIIWAPGILREAAETGMFLSRGNELIDTLLGQSPEDVLHPLSPEQLTSIDHYDDDELADRHAADPELRWSERALLSSVLGSAHRVAIAPVLGHGLTEDRRSGAPIPGAHGFGIEWMTVTPGATTGWHRHDDSQVALLVEGDWEVAVNGSDDEVSCRPFEGSVVSVPPGAWRDLRNVGATEARAAIVTGGDGPTRLIWSDDVIERAGAAGYGLDAAGYLAPLDLLGRSWSTAPGQTNGSPNTGRNNQ
ncbi:MAG: cupin domain-containing protein [Actinomycetota bacterium]